MFKGSIVNIVHHVSFIDFELSFFLNKYILKSTSLYLFSDHPNCLPLQIQYISKTKIQILIDMIEPKISHTSEHVESNTYCCCCMDGIIILPQKYYKKWKRDDCTVANSRYFLERGTNPVWNYSHIIIKRRLYSNIYHMLWYWNK